MLLRQPVTVAAVLGIALYYRCRSLGFSLPKPYTQRQGLWPTDSSTCAADAHWMVHSGDLLHLDSSCGIGWHDHAVLWPSAQAGGYGTPVPAHPHIVTHFDSNCTTPHVVYKGLVASPFSSRPEAALPQSNDCRVDIVWGFPLGPLLGKGPRAC